MGPITEQSMLKQLTDVLDSVAQVNRLTPQERRDLAAAVAAHYEKELKKIRFTHLTVRIETDGRIDSHEEARMKLEQLLDAQFIEGEQNLGEDGVLGFTVMDMDERD